MYRPYNLHKIMKQCRNNDVSNDSIYDIFMNCIKKEPPKPLHRWCHPESEQYKNKCNPWLKVEHANSDNHYESTISEKKK